MTQITLFFKLQRICFKFAGTTVDDASINYGAFYKNLLIRIFLIAPKCVKIMKKPTFRSFSPNWSFPICFKFAWLTVVGMKSSYAAFRKILLVETFFTKLFRHKNPFF